MDIEAATIKKNFKKVAIATVDDYVNVRADATTESEIVGKVYNDQAVVIKKKLDNGWYKIKSGKVKGYVKADFFITGSEAKDYAVKNSLAEAKVKCDALRVREKAGTTNEIITNIYKNEKYETKKFVKSKKWVKIEVDESTDGFVSTEYVKILSNVDSAVTLEEDAQSAGIGFNTIVETAQTETVESEQTNITENIEPEVVAEVLPVDSLATSQNTLTKGEEVVAYAKQFLGNPYVWGGSSLTNGTDCSGFTMSVYQHFGYSLNRASYQQINNGIAVDLNSLVMGDLVFYKCKGNRIDHVAMYIGNNQIIHASTSKTGIIISDLGSPCDARRIIY